MLGLWVVLNFKAVKTSSPQSIYFLISTPAAVLLSSPPAPLLFKERGARPGQGEVVDEGWPTTSVEACRGRVYPSIFLQK